MLRNGSLLRLLATIPAAAALLAQTAPQPASVAGTGDQFGDGRAHLTRPRYVFLHA